MFKAMIQSPMSGERVEEVIFNIPSTMACLPEVTARKLRKRESGCPPPVMFFNVFEPLFGNASSPRDSLMGMEHTEGCLDPFGIAKPFRVPELSQPPGLIPKTGFHLRKQALRILKQNPLIPLDDGQVLHHGEDAKSVAR